MRAHVLPHYLAVARDLEGAPVASLTDQRIAVRQSLRARNVGTEEFEERLIGVLPDDRARAWVHLDDARERGRVIAAVRAVVEDEDVPSGQRPRIVLLREGWAAELPDDLPRGSLDHHDRRDVPEAHDEVAVCRFRHRVAMSPLGATVLWSDRMGRRIEMLPASPLPDDVAAGGHLQQVIGVHRPVGFGARPAALDAADDVAWQRT